MRAALILFYNHGTSGAGIDAIVERASAAKKGLKCHVASKAELVNQTRSIASLDQQ